MFPERHPLSLGVVGHGGHRSARDYLARCPDVVLAVATGFSEPATDGWSPALQGERALIRIDVDAVAMGTAFCEDICLVGDAAQTMEAIAARLARRSRPPARFGVVREHGGVDDSCKTLRPAEVFAALSQTLPTDALYTCDIGEHLLWATHCLPIDRPDAFRLMTGLASMGSAVGAAVGHRLAEPDRTVVAICGDGGFAMSAAEIGTAASHGVGVVVCVMNDESFGMVEVGHERAYGRRPGYPVAYDVAGLARAMGARATTVATLDDLRRTMAELVVADAPIVVDVHIDTQPFPRFSRSHFGPTPTSKDPRR